MPTMTRKQSIDGGTYDVHPKLIEDLIGQTPRVATATILLSLIYIGIFRQFVPPLELGIWFTLQVLSTAYRLHNVRNLERFLKEENREELRKHQAYFMVFSFCQASAWVMSAVLVVIHAPAPYEMISLVIAIGVVNSAALSMTSIYKAYLIFYFVNMVPQMFIMLYYGEPHHIGLLMIILIAIPATLILSKAIHESRLENIEAHDELEESVRKLYELSISDNLTNAYNRRYFFEASDELIEIATRERNKASLIMLDVDHFKRINDDHGHQAGDFILINLAREIKSILRDSDIFARIGGEEFSIFLNQTSLDGARVVAEKIRSVVENKVFQYESASIQITVSIGISELNDRHTTADELYKESDKKLYIAKASGRNQVSL